MLLSSVMQTLCITLKPHPIISLFACILYFQIDVRIQDEDLRARKFFHHVSFSRVLRECEARLVEDYIPYLQGECRQMIKDENRTGSFIFGLLLLHRKALLHRRALLHRKALFRDTVPCEQEREKLKNFT